ncbi:DgyrCDS2843 [Dimorphilus gyrociliatus]|uniref:DgyrCDS2843 n=1 Tax=Dimorphilus gyrociliatus TaxID=2664684 RepID=A0A7I8VCP7_9ANNE|nr:DgyrCDS2843 [Dimorphilus gyrociliatus]
MSVSEVNDEIDSQKIMDKILDIVKDLTGDDGDITRKIVAPFQKINNKFLNSKGFYDFLLSMMERLGNQPTDKYQIINELIDELKAYSGTKKRKSDTPIVTDEKKKKKSETMSEDVRTKRLQKLEKLLQSLHKRIKEEDEREISLDEMESENAHTYVHRLKRKLVAVYAKICELEERDLTLGRKMEKKVNFSATQYTELNKKVSKLINQGRHFPDFCDVLTLIQRCNVKYNYNLSNKRIEGLAREIFTEVGNALQKRRQDDDRQNFGCHLTDSIRDETDPAEMNYGLRKKLDENRKINIKNIDDIMNKYTRLQEEKQDDQEESSTEEDGSDSESCDDETILDVSQELLEDFPSSTEGSVPLFEISEESDDTEDEIVISRIGACEDSLNNLKEKDETSPKRTEPLRSTARKSTAVRKRAVVKAPSPLPSSSPKNVNSLEADEDDDILILHVKASSEVNNYQIPPEVAKQILQPVKRETQKQTDSSNVLIVISDSD